MGGGGTFSIPEAFFYCVTFGLIGNMSLSRFIEGRVEEKWRKKGKR